MEDALAHFRRLYDVDYSDREAVAERWDPELVIDQDPGLGSERTQYRGYEGLRDLVRETVAFYTEQSWEPQQAIEQEDGRYVVLLRVRGTGRVSGVPIEVEIGHVVTLRDGRFLHVESCLGWDAAREAGGVASSGES